MKKTLILVLVMTFLLGLVGCDPGGNSVDADEILSNTVKIELFYYENDKPKLIRPNRFRKPFFDFSKATYIATLNDSHMEAIVKDIAENEFLVFGNALREPIGKTMILYQRDGNMIVLCSCVYTKKNGEKRYYGECNIFDENGKFVEHIGRIGSDYVDILESQYFESNP